MFLQRFGIIIFLVLLSCSLFAQPSSYEIKTKINQIIDQTTEPMFIGIKIQSLANNNILYEKNARRLFEPASNLKLFTALAALIYLTPNYTFNTQLLTNGKIYNQTLHGDLYLKFSGDPDLTVEDLNHLILQLKALGANTINGNIYLDNSMLGGRNEGPGWMWDETNLCYAAPINAIMINHNCVKFLLSPSSVAHLTHLKALPYAQFAKINNRSITTNKNSENCPLELTTTGNNKYSLTGCLAAHSKPIELSIALTDPQKYAAKIIYSLLKSNGIHFNSEILIKKTPDNLRVLAFSSSKPLSVLVHEMLKNSDNQIANILFKTLGAKYFNQIGTWQNGTIAVKNILSQQAHINITDAAILDGSGLSRYNLVSPEQISQILDFVYHDQLLAQDYISALPIAGVDGTLEDRMQTPLLKNKVHAKTGTMTGVSSLSGFVQTQHEGILSFVIMLNNFSGKDEFATHFEDEIVQYLASL